jgi:hypothetical protein
MSLRLYEQRVGELKATVDREGESLRNEKARLADIKERWTDATQQAAEMTGRAEAAELVAATSRQEVSTAALLEERTAELEAAKRGHSCTRSQIVRSRFGSTKP